MYTAHEYSLLTKEFWTTLGRYLSPVLSATGEKINWVNYKTKQKNIRFRMMVDNNAARLSIILSGKEPALQPNCISTFLQLKKVFGEVAGEDWQWELYLKEEKEHHPPEIYIELTGVNIFNRADWPAIISFLKLRIIALDKFWSEYKYAFET